MFVQYNENPRENFRAGDCVVRAISVVTGDSWEKIYVELCAEGYFMGDWGNNNAVWDAYLRRRGFKRYICPNDFEELMDEAPDEATRKKFERLMMEMK